MARPSKYHPAYNNQAYKLTLLGHIDTELATFFGVSQQTINTWKKKHPKFLESIKKGKDISDAEVAVALRKRALGYKVKEVRVKVSKQGIENAEEFLKEGKGMPDYVTEKTVIEKEIPGDVSAQAIWLFNRQPGKWKRNREVSDSGDKIIYIKVEGKTHMLDDLKEDNEE